MPIFRNNSKTRMAIYAFVALFLLAGATHCAYGHENPEPVLVSETGAAVIRGTAQTIGFNVIWPDAGPKDADFLVGLQLVGSSHERGKAQPNQAAIQVQMIDGFGKFEVGVGVVVLQNIDTYNSSHANFSLSLGYRITKRLGVIARHWSNAGTVGGNTGRDMLLVTWRF